LTLSGRATAAITARSVQLIRRRGVRPCGQLVAQDEDLDLCGVSERARSTLQLNSFANIW
jgi:hypothetical protein